MLQSAPYFRRERHNKAKLRLNFSHLLERKKYRNAFKTQLKDGAYEIKKNSCTA